MPSIARCTPNTQTGTRASLPVGPTTGQQTSSSNTDLHNKEKRPSEASKQASKQLRPLAPLAPGRYMCACNGLSGYKVTFQQTIDSTYRQSLLKSNMYTTVGVGEPRDQDWPSVTRRLEFGRSYNKAFMMGIGWSLKRR